MRTTKARMIWYGEKFNAGEHGCLFPSADVCYFICQEKLFHLWGHNSNLLLGEASPPPPPITHHISFFYFHGSYKESANFFYKGQTTGQIQLASCFYMADELRMVFMFLNGWGKKKIKSIILTFFDSGKLYEIQISVSKV